MPRFALEPKIVTVDKQLNLLLLFAGGEVEYIQDVGVPIGEKGSQITLTDVDADEYDAYCTALEEKGYALMQENTIGQNHFSVYGDDNVCITAYYLGLNDTARIIVENDRAISPDKTEYTTVCDTTLMQLGLDKNNSDISTSMNAYIVQLADGRFVLMDTGLASAAPYLYRYMKDRTPEGEPIRIAAVFISHPHVDHMDGLEALSEKYAKKLYVRVFTSITAHSVCRTAMCSPPLKIIGIRRSMLPSDLVQSCTLFGRGRELSSPMRSLRRFDALRTMGIGSSKTTTMPALWCT